MRGHDFDTNTLDALCEKCKEYGVGGVQLVLLRSLADFKKGNFTPEYANQSVINCVKTVFVCRFWAVISIRLTQTRKALTKALIILSRIALCKIYRCGNGRS